LAIGNIAVNEILLDIMKENTMHIPNSRTQQLAIGNMLFKVFFLNIMPSHVGNCKFFWWQLVFLMHCLVVLGC
jgi:hypothetical protein